MSVCSTCCWHFLDFFMIITTVFAPPSHPHLSINFLIRSQQDVARELLNMFVAASPRLGLQGDAYASEWFPTWFAQLLPPSQVEPVGCQRGSGDSCGVESERPQRAVMV